MNPASFTKANRNLQRAIARGDIDTAVRWTLVICKQIQIARAFADLATPKPVAKRRREKPKPDAAPLAAATPVSNMPVMLDPDGVSPGGTPNWVLNQNRLERAGLPRSLAPVTRAALRSQRPTGT